MATIVIDPNAAANLAADGIPTSQLPLSSDAIFGVAEAFPYPVQESGSGGMVLPGGTTATFSETWTDGDGVFHEFGSNVDVVGTFDPLDPPHLFSGLYNFLFNDVGAFTPTKPADWSLPYPGGTPGEGVFRNGAPTLPMTLLAGNDTITNLSGMPTLLNGYAGNDHLVAGSGGDTLDGGSGADTMDGGPGNDRFYVDNPNDVVHEAAGGGTDIVYVSAPQWTATPGAELEQLVALGTANISLTGNGHAMTLIGNAGVNTLDDGGAADTLTGGDGNDVYLVSSLDSTIVETSTGGYDTVKTHLSSYTLPDNVEKLVFTSFPGGGSVDFTGIGNAGNNDISGGAGNDTLDGGAGADRLTGGSGNDTYYFDNAGDYAVEQAGGGDDTIYASVDAKASPNVEHLIYTGTTGAALYAAATGTSVVGGQGNDKIWGGAGNDTLDGGTGSERVVVGPDGSMTFFSDVDILFGGAGADTFVLHPYSSDGVSRILDFSHGVDHIAISDPLALPDLFEFTTVAPIPPDPIDPGHNFTQTIYYDQAHGALYRVDNTNPFNNETLIATLDNHPTLSPSDFIFT